MVYRGKPSAACGECRKRRSKCDQAIPACGQCIKTKRNCPGYRNPADLMFFDESSQVAQKQKNRSRSLASQDIQSSYQEPSQQLMVQPADKVNITDFVMYQPIDEVGVSFFMTSFVGRDPSTAQFDYLPEYYSREGYSIPGLQQCLVACGLAGYAKTIHRSDILEHATKKYVVAIRSVNNALSNSKSAAKESTLLSVIILAMFEVMIVPRASGMLNMTKHLDGAITIANMCIKNGPPSPMARRLIATLIQSTIMNCWLQSLPFPRNFFALKKALGQGSTSSRSDHAKFLDLVVEVVLFENAIEVFECPLPEAFISRAHAIDEKFSDLETDLSAREPFDVFRILEAPEHLIFGTCYHVYSQPFDGHLWNNIRHSRLRILRAILAHYNSLLSGPRTNDRSLIVSLKADLEDLIIQITHDICATLPYLGGYVDQLQPYSPSKQEKPEPIRTLPTGSSKKDPQLYSPSVEPSGHSGHEPDPFKRTVSLVYLSCVGELDQKKSIFVNQPRPKPASIYHLLYQLHALSFIDCLPQDTKDWIRGRLAWIEAHADQKELGRFREVMKENAKKRRQRLASAKSTD